MELIRVFGMSLTRDEFLRQLAAAMENESIAEEGNTFRHEEPGRGWRITLQPLPPNVLGAITLERQRVEIQFTGYSAQEAGTFLDRFAMHFRRGRG